MEKEIMISKRSFIKAFDEAAAKQNFESKDYNWAQAMWEDYTKQIEFKEKFAWGQRDFSKEGEWAFVENQELLKDL